MINITSVVEYDEFIDFVNVKLLVTTCKTIVTIKRNGCPGIHS